MKCAESHNQLTRAIVDQWPKERENHKRDAFWPSETSLCCRQIAYSLSGEPETDSPTVANLQMMSLGDALEDWVASHMPVGLEIAYRQVPLRETLFGAAFSGRPDGVICKYGGPAGAIIEIKSTGPRSYVSTCQNFMSNMEHWSTGYYLQANRTAHLWNAVYPNEQVDRFVIFLLNRAGEEDESTKAIHRDWWFYLDQDWLKADVESLLAIREKLEHGGIEAVPRITEKPTTFCSRCNWRSRCWGDSLKPGTTLRAGPLTTPRLVFPARAGRAPSVLRG